MPAPNQITISQLQRLIGTPDSPSIIDVRTDEDFAGDPRLIPGAQRCRFDAVDALAPTLAGRRAVIVCHRGKKLSEGAAALLRTHGVGAEALQGGAVGWSDAGALTIRPGIAPVSGIWVTRHRPKIDRVACPWLIRRFVDPSARFLFVPPSEVTAVAEHFQAAAFDLEDVFWSHRGDLCTFDVMLEEFGLASEALARLAAVVRAADTNRHDLAPEAAGLLAMSVGMSRMHRDDLEQLEASFPIYDALYRWARDGFDEAHDWPGTKGAAS